MNSAVNVNITNRAFIVEKLKEGHAIAREIKVPLPLVFRTLRIRTAGIRIINTTLDPEPHGRCGFWIQM